MLRVMFSLSLCLIAVQAQAESGKEYPYQSCFEVAAKMHNVPLELLLAVAATESDWDADARSHANAHGVMQIQWPGTARHLGVKRVAELYNPCFNISLGAKYLAQLLRDFDGGETRALAAYNYGPTRIAASPAIPKGAQKYVDTVNRHRRQITHGLVPKRLQPERDHVLVAFSSRSRAERLAAHLQSHLQGALVSVRKTSPLTRKHAVVLAIGNAGLTVQDHVTIRNLGWTL